MTWPPVFSEYTLLVSHTQFCFVIFQFKNFFPLLPFIYAFRFVSFVVLRQALSI